MCQCFIEFWAEILSMDTTTFYEKIFEASSSEKIELFCESNQSPKKIEIVKRVLKAKTDSERKLIQEIF